MADSLPSRLVALFQCCKQITPLVIPRAGSAAETKLWRTAEALKCRNLPGPDASIGPAAQTSPLTLIYALLANTVISFH